MSDAAASDAAVWTYGSKSMAESRRALYARAKREVREEGTISEMTRLDLERAGVDAFTLEQTLKEIA